MGIKVLKYSVVSFLICKHINIKNCIVMNSRLYKVLSFRFASKGFIVSFCFFSCGYKQPLSMLPGVGSQQTQAVKTKKNALERDLSRSSEGYTEIKKALEGARDKVKRLEVSKSQIDRKKSNLIQEKKAIETGLSSQLNEKASIEKKIVQANDEIEKIK